MSLRQIAESICRSCPVEVAWAEVVLLLAVDVAPLGSSASASVCKLEERDFAFGEVEIEIV